MGIYNENPLDNLSGDQIQQLFNRAVADASTEDQTKQEREAALDFLELRPEYKANPRNGAILQTALDYSGTKINSFEDIDRIYLDLRERGLLELDAAELKRQEQAARQARINHSRGTIQQRGHAAINDPESDAWTMPLEDVIRLANEEMSTQESGGMPGFDEERGIVPRSRRRSGI